MAFNSGKGPRQALSEINVTPLVDVMLVLLIIFMVAAGVQTVEMEETQQKVLQEAEEILEKAERVHEQKERRRKVELDLPRVNSEEVNLNEVKKLKLKLDGKLRFILGDTTLVDCFAVAPDMISFIPTQGKRYVPTESADKVFKPCLKALGEKLIDNHKLQEDKELYLLADRRLDYGMILKVMAVIRQAGVTKFGLVARPDLIKGVESVRTPEAIQ